MVDGIFQDINANILLNYYDGKTQIKKWVERTRNLNSYEKGKLLIDSGAFPVWHRSLPDIDVKEYAKFLNGLDNFYGYAINLDKIPGKKGTKLTSEHIKQGSDMSFYNYNVLLQEYKHPEKVLPVYHYTDPIEDLHRLIDSAPPSNYICLALGARVLYSIKYAWLLKMYEEIGKSSNPSIKTHVLGATMPRLLDRVPATSADSSTWSIINRNGFTLEEFFITPRTVKYPNHYNNLTKETQDMIRNTVESYGLDLDLMMQDGKEAGDERSLFELFRRQDWAMHYTYTPITTTQNTVFNAVNKGV
jgi:hypothetical protein